MPSPERTQRERESQNDPETKYEQLREAEAAERAELADDLVDDDLPPRET